MKAIRYFIRELFGQNQRDRVLRDAVISAEWHGRQLENIACLGQPLIWATEPLKFPAIDPSLLPTKEEA